MAKLDHIVTATELSNAVKAWNRIMNGGYNRKSKTYINPYVFLGYNNINLVDTSEVKCTELAYQKIKMLNSPHARALLKAFKARTGYHATIP